jgi:uncharacterized membrane protein
MSSGQSSIVSQKKTGGCCLLTSGIVLTVVGIASLLFGVLITWMSMDAHDRHMQENDEKLEAYYVDSAAINARMRDLEIRQGQAWESGDTVLYQQLTDSLSQTGYPSDLYVGFPIGGAFGMAFAVIGLLPLVVGIVLLFVYRSKQKKARLQAINSYSDV